MEGGGAGQSPLELGRKKLRSQARAMLSSSAGVSMPMTSMPKRLPDRFHAVRFYEDDASLCRMAAGFLSEGLAAESPAIVVATPTHRAGIEQELAALSVDLDELQRSGALLFIDAEEALAEFMIDGLPDAERFQAVFSHAIVKVCQERSNRVVRAYGEMVDVLWKNGNHVGAIRLEMLWNQLANWHRFSLLCGYSMGHFYKDAPFMDICREHTHVVAPDGDIAPSVPTSLH
jgi:DcmR-like sensory protein